MKFLSSRSIMDSEKVIIYIVDDDDDDKLLSIEAIKQVIPNSKIMCFSHGKHCLEYLLTNKSMNTPDLILMDLNMPIMNGFDTLKEMRKNDPLHIFQVVIFSTTTSEDQKNTAVSLGAKDFFVKPMNFNELVKIIEVIKHKYL